MIIGLGIGDATLAAAREAGAERAIHLQRLPIAEILADCDGRPDGHGPDVVIEVAGTPDTFRAAVEIAAYTGRVIYIGYAKERVTYEASLFVQKELDSRGARNALPEDFRPGDYDAEAAPFSGAICDQHSWFDRHAPQILSAWSADPRALLTL